jgi:hypothetical protein
MNSVHITVDLFKYFNIILSFTITSTIYTYICNMYAVYKGWFNIAFHNFEDMFYDNKDLKM